MPLKSNKTCKIKETKWNTNKVNGWKHYFELTNRNEGLEDVVLNLVVKSLIFQDDIASASKTIDSAQAKNDKMEAMLETKLLDMNSLKSVVLITGTEQYKDSISNRIKHSPLTIYKEPMKQVTEYSYLGEIVHSGGLSASNTATISKRIGLAYKSIFEIKSIIEDPRNMKPGGLFTASH